MKWGLGQSPNKEDSMDLDIIAIIVSKVYIALLDSA